ncbi:hypothetical protein ACH5RR_038686 [Cinchona calisaya]|uniref:Uncharacterized protein n=1 Tax=Cinchona calisaya TaxID=153742 RepID=A0ABD2Y1M5_9GENT
MLARTEGLSTIKVLNTGHKSQGGRRTVQAYEQAQYSQRRVGKGIEGFGKGLKTDLDNDVLVPRLASAKLFTTEGLTARVEDLAGSLASMPFPSWDRPISIEDVPPNRARLTSSSKERSIWHRKQALERLSPYDRFFFHMVCSTDESANSDALSNPVLLLKNICRSELSCLGSAVASGISNLALSWSSPTPLLSDDNRKYLASESKQVLVFGMSVEGLKEEELGKSTLTSCVALSRSGIPINMTHKVTKRMSLLKRRRKAVEEIARTRTSFFLEDHQYGTLFGLGFRLMERHLLLGKPSIGGSKCRAFFGCGGSNPIREHMGNEARVGVTEHPPWSVCGNGLRLKKIPLALRMTKKAGSKRVTAEQQHCSSWRHSPMISSQIVLSRLSHPGLSLRRGPISYLIVGVAIGFASTTAFPAVETLSENDKERTNNVVGCSPYRSTKFEAYTSPITRPKKRLSVAPLESKPFEAPVVVAVATPTLSFLSLRIPIYMTSGQYKARPARLLLGPGAAMPLNESNARPGALGRSAGSFSVVLFPPRERRGKRYAQRAEDPLRVFIDLERYYKSSVPDSIAAAIWFTGTTKKSHAYVTVTDGLIILDHEDPSRASGFHSHHHILLMINLLVLCHKNLESVSW